MPETAYSEYKLFYPDPLGLRRKKKLFFLVARPLKGGGMGKGPATKEKGTFKKTFFWSRWKIQYILFKTTYANIYNSVKVYCV